MGKLTLKATGELVEVVKEQGNIRAGTRMVNPDGRSHSLLEMMDAAKLQLQADGLVVHAPGQMARRLGYAGPKIPKPEDYILARSKMTLADLYDDARVLPRGAAIDKSLASDHPRATFSGAIGVSWMDHIPGRDPVSRNA